MSDELPAPLLGEWACLGILYDEPAHGWAVASRLKRDGDIGRIWHLSRPLTYRALDRLGRRGWIRPIAEEPGEAGPNRTVLAATRSGRARFRGWVRTPVEHLRDLRGELLVKLTFSRQLGIDIAEMLDRQRALVDDQAAAFEQAVVGTGGSVDDVVALWRLEATRAAQRFLDHLPR